ncbi:MAG TPA: hypothetical protein VIT92_07575, partial [Burkholderiaceae bacterium]
MQQTQQKQAGLLAIIALFSGAVFLLDLVTALGMTEWVFYLIPVALSVFQQNRFVPFIAAGVQTALIVAGYYFSPSGINPEMAAINRAFGAVSLYVVAALVYRVIQEKARAQELMWLQEGQTAVAAGVLGEKDVLEA